MHSPSGAKREKGKEVGVRCWRGVPHHPLRSLKSLVVACLLSHGPHVLCASMSCLQNTWGMLVNVDISAQDSKNVLLHGPIGERRRDPKNKTVCEEG